MGNCIDYEHLRPQVYHHIRNLFFHQALFIKTDYFPSCFLDIDRRTEIRFRRDGISED